MKSTLSIAIISLTLALFSSCKKDNSNTGNKVEVIKANGDIHDDVAAFKNRLKPVNITPNAVGGHREINWEGVPDNFLDKPLPGNFFNPTGENAVAARQRGLAYSGGSFMASNNGFAAINSGASSEFEAFSGTKTFANITASKWDISFQIVGTTDSVEISVKVYHHFGAKYTTHFRGVKAD